MIKLQQRQTAKAEYEVVSEVTVPEVKNLYLLVL